MYVCVPQDPQRKPKSLWLYAFTVNLHQQRGRGGCPPPLYIHKMCFSFIMLTWVHWPNQHEYTEPVHPGQGANSSKVH